MPAPKQQAPLQASQFDMEANPNAIAGVQANETFMLTANKNGALGETGETVGYAKYKFDNDKFNKLNRNVIRTLGKDEPLKLARNGLNNAVEALARNDDSVSPELVQSKLAAAVIALKKALPEEQRAAVDDFANDPAQVIGSLDNLRDGITEKVELLKESFKGMTNIANTSSNLFPKGAMVVGDPLPEGEVVDENTVFIEPDRGLLARSVASYQVDQLLGTNSVSEEKFGVDAEGKAVGVSIQVDGAGITGKFRDTDGIKKDALLEVDITDPQIQRGLADLEAVDYLTGQIDRHCGNIFVDPQTKKVTGIDNDLAFPEISREEMFANEGEFTGKAVTGMPRQMHVETAQKILALDPAQLRATLEGMKCPEGVSPLGSKAIDSICDRLSGLQQELVKPDSQIKVVAEFNKQTYLEAIDEQDKAFKAATTKKNDQGDIIAPGVDLTDASREHLGQLDTCVKTSYLGAVAAQTKKYELGIALKPEEFCVRPAETAQKAPRSGVVVTQQVNQLQQEIAALEAKQQGYQDRLDKLEHPRAGDRLKALAHGGVKGTKEFFKAKDENVTLMLKEKNAQLDKVLQGAPADIQDQLYQRAHREKPVFEDNRPVFEPKNNAAPPPIGARVPLQNLPPPVAVQNVAPPPIGARVPLQNLPPPVAVQNVAPPPIGARVPLQNLPPPVDVDNSKVAKTNIPSKTGEISVADQASLQSGPEAHEQVDDDSLTVEPESLSSTTELPTHGVESSSSTNTHTQAPKRNTVGDALKRSTSLPELNTLRQGKALGEDGPAGEKSEVKKDNSLRASGGWQSAKPSSPALPAGSLKTSHP